MTTATVTWPNVSLEKFDADSFVVGQERDGRWQEIRFGASVAVNFCDWLSRLAQASEPPTVQTATAEAVSITPTTPVADWPNLGLQKVDRDSFIVRQRRDGNVQEVRFGMDVAINLCNWLKRYLSAEHRPAFKVVDAAAVQAGR
jgi:hypothetical protein